ncbi:hypothetical protein PanWU01x14_223590 [Parasponia andersonii]|uniref:Uncharacterized protein n=1 Tax=Parasponia andersonii TaxID=3476 RepID=A0A2P5BNK2_PARAD|nr:hypothetical protein PanWU01x14_223590 [Parasponia andersonii]
MCTMSESPELVTVSMICNLSTLDKCSDGVVTPTGEIFEIAITMVVAAELNKGWRSSNSELQWHLIRKFLAPSSLAVIYDKDSNLELVEAFLSD